MKTKMPWALWPNRSKNQVIADTMHETAVQDAQKFTALIGSAKTKMVNLCGLVLEKICAYSLGFWVVPRARQME